MSRFMEVYKPTEEGIGYGISTQSFLVGIELAILSIIALPFMAKAALIGIITGTVLSYAGFKAMEYYTKKYVAAINKAMKVKTTRDKVLRECDKHISHYMKTHKVKKVIYDPQEAINFNAKWDDPDTDFNFIDYPNENNCYISDNIRLDETHTIIVWGDDEVVGGLACQFWAQDNKGVIRWVLREIKGITPIKI